MGGRKTKACEEKKREMKLARSTSLIGLNSQLKLNSKILRTWKKERESFISLNAQGMRGGGTPVDPFIGEPKGGLIPPAKSKKK
jgi:hypothetical protein